VSEAIIESNDDHFTYVNIGRRRDEIRLTCSPSVYISIGEVRLPDEDSR
jgi:hypothetical protein